MKFLIILGVTLLLFIAVVTSVSLFLVPDNLAGCEPTPSQEASCVSADAIVAVSGGDTNARTDAAIELYRQGWAPLLIFSGAAQDPQAPSNAQAMKDRAITQGVPADDVVIEEFARNTAENAANTSAFINKRDLSRIVLVTSAYHQRRASLEFGARLGGAVQIVNAPVAQDKQWGRFWWLTPGGWWLASGELIKIAAYHITGGNI